MVQDFIKRSTRRGAFSKLRVFLFIGIIVLLAWYISTYWYQLMLIQGRSMEPTLHDFQLVVLDKHFTSSELERGNIVAFQCDGLDAVLVKRVVALPGDTVSIKDGILYLNGEPSEFYEGIKFEYEGLLKKEVVVTADCYVVMGDNVAESKDSRYNEVGIIESGNIKGILLNR